MLAGVGRKSAGGFDSRCCDLQRCDRSTLWHPVRGSAIGSMRDATSSHPSARSSAENQLLGGKAFNDRGGRSELAVLYVRVADALERSAQLADEHARARANQRAAGLGGHRAGPGQASTRGSAPRARPRFGIELIVNERVAGPLCGLVIVRFGGRGPESYGDSARRVGLSTEGPRTK